MTLICNNYLSSNPMRQSCIISSITWNINFLYSIFDKFAFINRCIQNLFRLDIDKNLVITASIPFVVGRQGKMAPGHIHLKWTTITSFNDKMINDLWSCPCANALSDPELRRSTCYNCADTHYLWLSITKIKNFNVSSLCW